MKTTCHKTVTAHKVIGCTDITPSICQLVNGAETDTNFMY